MQTERTALEIFLRLQPVNVRTPISDLCQTHERSYELHISIEVDDEQTWNYTPDPAKFLPHHFRSGVGITEGSPGI